MKINIGVVNKKIVKIYKYILFFFAIPIILSPYFSRKTGREYKITFIHKLVLLSKMVRNQIRIPSASGFIEHLIMATDILNTPASQDGVVIECGCYKGGSTANLSLVASLCNRKLHIFDSFEGLPEPTEIDKHHYIPHKHEIHAYEKGHWTGMLDEVKHNITQYGDIKLCIFHKGYFQDTLPSFNMKSILIFSDSDLVLSTKICIKYLWPLLNDNCKFYIHEAQHINVAELFFNNEWWKNELHSNPPGLIGVGTGMGLYPRQNGFHSALAYTIKNPSFDNFKKIIEKG